MNAPDPLREELRESIAELLEVELEEVVPEARFFHDLGGESLDVLDMTFRFERKYGVPVRFQQLLDPRDGTASADATGTSENFRRLRERFPFLENVDLESAATPDDLKSLFTVDLIVATVRHALAANIADPSAAPSAPDASLRGSSNP
ncbi:MAG: acyl carrier protein [Planctomycetaceae bacterium]